VANYGAYLYRDCPHCVKRIMVKIDGTLRAHIAKPGDTTLCEGTGRVVATPAEVVAARRKALELRGKPVSPPKSAAMRQIHARQEAAATKVATKKEQVTQVKNPEGDGPDYAQSPAFVGADEEDTINLDAPTSDPIMDALTGDPIMQGIKDLVRTYDPHGHQALREKVEALFKQAHGAITLIEHEVKIAFQELILVQGELTAAEELMNEQDSKDPIIKALNDNPELRPAIEALVAVMAAKK
jgi:hypothetical protein